MDSARVKAIKLGVTYHWLRFFFFVFTCSNYIVPCDLFECADRSGLCSFYQGDGTTANGEPFRQSDMTAAHRTLPFNTTVRVASGNRSVVVRVNDRGPFVKGRILDMSKGAAEKLGILTEGVVPCELTVLSPKIVCKKDWDNTCVTHDECCSQNCDKQPKWKHGVCKPAVVL